MFSEEEKEDDDEASGTAAAAAAAAAIDRDASMHAIRWMDEFTTCMKPIVTLFSKVLYSIVR